MFLIADIALLSSVGATMQNAM